MLSPSAVGYSRLLEWVLRIEQAAGVLSALLSSIQTHVDEQLGRILIMENGKVLGNFFILQAVTCMSETFSVQLLKGF